MPRKPKKGPAVAAVEHDLKELAKRDAKIPKSALAASALEMARELDGDNSATSKSMCARVLLDTLERIEATAPPVKEKDELDDLRRRRAAKTKRRAKTKSRVGSA